MDELKPPKIMQSRMELTSDLCDLHSKPVQKMVLNGEIVCPRCKTEESNLAFEEKIQAEIRLQLQNEKYRTLQNRSIIEDNTLLNARIYNYMTHEQEETTNKHTVQEAIKHYEEGEIFNLVLQGNPGAGKSHLAYAVLHELNEKRKGSCLFVSVEAMLRKIKATFRDKESKYTEEYFNHLLSDVDYLVLDDLGAETGAIDTEKTATDFVQRVLYGIATSRQTKVTILTTNLDSKTLFSMYDKKLVSRLLRTPKVVTFKETKDKRLKNTLF